MAISILKLLSLLYIKNRITSLANKVNPLLSQIITRMVFHSQPHMATNPSRLLRILQDELLHKKKGVRHRHKPTIHDPTGPGLEMLAESEKVPHMGRELALVQVLYAVEDSETAFYSALLYLGVLF
jgi:hypothetical protein